jgi:hypothetical protein
MESSKEKQAARMRELNLLRGRKLAHAYAEATKEARTELTQLWRDPLFVAGVMLYAEKGDRGAKTPIGLTTAHPKLAQTFAHFLITVCGIPEERVRAHLLLYPAQDEWLVRIHWAKESGLPARNFTKCSRIKGKGTKDGFGLCTVTVSNAYLKLKLLEWVKELPKELKKAR